MVIPGAHPQNEEYWGNVNPVGIRSCYDEEKDAQRLYLWIITNTMVLMSKYQEYLTLMVQI